MLNNKLLRRIISLTVSAIIIPSNIVYASDNIDLLDDSSIQLEDSNNDILMIEDDQSETNSDNITMEDDILNNSILMPSITGLSRDEAINKLSQAGIDIADIIFKYTNTDTSEEDTVLSQSISAGTTINQNDKIQIELAATPTEITPESSVMCLWDHYEICKNNADPPTIDNGTWNDYPCSYEFNWDNSESCWYWGIWGGNGNLTGYTTQAGTYDANVRHKMCMYCDGTNVSLYIKYAACYGAPGNGDDFNFYIDNQPVKFYVVYSDTKQSLCANRAPGTYDVTILHENKYPSSWEALGATGKMVIHKNNINNELEISIPLEQFKKQNKRRK